MGHQLLSANDGSDHQGDDHVCQCLLGWSYCFQYHQGGISNTLRRSVEEVRRSGFDSEAMTKCQLAMSDCTYLGHVAGSGVVKIVASKLQAVDQFPKPTTKKQVHLFLGLTGYYRRFILHYTTIAAPLYKKFEPHKVNWTAECGKAFNKLKEMVVS